MELFGPATVLYFREKDFTEELKTELIRKSIHILIALVPLIASLLGATFTLALLAGGVLFYSYAEYQRTQGRSIPLITRITYAAARRTDKEGIILGPITLGIGAMVSLLLYPAPASIIAIYALAFGDSISSIAGKLFGRSTFPFLKGKTLEGSFACFILVFFLTYRLIGTPISSLVIAGIATALEAIPVKDLDNIILPMGSGFAASLFLA
ncbi:MAG: phosphatidate cytidylyltransferase [Spirochaetales bacterium]